MFLITISLVLALDDDVGILLTQVPKADGIYVVNFSLVTAESGGTFVFNHDLITGVNVTNNIAPIVVENLTGVDFSVPLWMHIIINGTTLDRKKLLYVAQSFGSNDSLTLGGKVEADLNVNKSNYMNASGVLNEYWFDTINDFTGAKTDAKICTWDNTASTLNCTYTDLTSSFGLNISSDSGSGDILDNEIFRVIGGNDINTSISGNNVTINSEVVDSDTVTTNGSGISLVGTQVNHSDTSAQASSDNSGRTYIQDILLDGFGHLTSIVTGTETVTDTTYTNSSFNTYLIPGNVSCARLNGSSSNLCTLTDTIYTESSKYLTLVAEDFSVDETELNDTILAISGGVQTTINATSVQVLTGTLDSGNLTSILDFNDGDTLNISEVSGTPGFEIRINFTGVSTFNTFGLRGRYDGGAGHTVHIELYQITTNSWIDFGIITDQTDFGTTSASVFNPELFINTTINSGTVQMRIIHDDSGITSHNYYLDYTAILQSVGVNFGGEHDATTGRNNQTNHPWAMDIYGTRDFIGDLNMRDINVTQIKVNDTILEDTDTTYDSDNTFISESSDVFSLNKTYSYLNLNANNSATATSLVANGGNCGAGEYPLGVDTSGAVESCTDATTEIDSAISTHAGDDDSHQALVTLTGQDYLTLSTQQITMGEIEPDDLASSDFGDFTCDGNTCSLDDSFQPLESTLTDIADGTINENLVNTANPWADNEVSDTLTCSILTDDDTYALTGSVETFDENVVFSKNITVENVKFEQNTSVGWSSNSSGCLIGTGATATLYIC